MVVAEVAFADVQLNLGGPIAWSMRKVRTVFYDRIRRVNQTCWFRRKERA